jgi:putative ABC transport system substrate-binding protein
MQRWTLSLFVMLLLIIFVTPRAAQAQPAVHVPRVGLLLPGSAAGYASRLEAFRHGLRDLGYVEGRTILLESRFADGQADRLPTLAAELAHLPVDVLVVDGTVALHPAQGATTTIPIVMVAGDPVGAGFVASLARPGGNITGLSMMIPELSGKRLELLQEAVGTLARVAVLRHRDAPVDPYVTETQTAAQALGLPLHVLEVRSPDEFAQAFAAMTRAQADALVVIPSGLFFSHRSQLAALAVQHRLPTIFLEREFVEAGGLLAYGPSMADLSRRAATYVDKILKGATPADLPVEQPTKFELVINLKTAQALGLTMPPSLLLLADEVIR